MIATHAVAQSGRLLETSSIPWQDLALVLAGVLFLVLASLIVYRRRLNEDDSDHRVTLIDVPAQPPPGQPPRPPADRSPRPAWTPPSFEHPVTDHGAPPQWPVAEETEGEEVRAGLVRFHRPPEGTLQLLPGRLDIVSGNERVDAIRFVKVPGKEPVVTFGRSQGEPHTHVELQSPTVSRTHAVMRFEKGSWHITNLSTTNPVVVRGRQVTVSDAPVRLEDGDRIEMGEVTFQFHVRQATGRAAEAVNRPLMERVAEVVRRPPVQPAAGLAERRPVDRATELVSRPLVDHPAQPVDRPLVQPAAELVERPLVEAAAELVDRPLPKLPFELVDRPLVQPAAEVVDRPLVEHAELVDHPLVKLAFKLADRSLHHAAQVVDLPVVEHAAAVVDRPPELEDAKVDASAPSRGWATGAARRPGPERMTASRAHVLTAREIEIALMVVERKSNRAIGEALDISPRTVSTHLTNIFRKLDVASRAEMADYVRRHGTG